MGSDLTTAAPGGATAPSEYDTRLRDLDRTKAMLVSTVSHELRTPVTAILGILEHLRSDPALTEEDADLVDLGVRGARRLWLLVEDILQLAEIDGRGIDLHLRPVDPALVIRQAIAELRFVGFDDVELTVQVDPVEGAQGDPARLQQLVAHLLTNAAKFNGPGGTVHVEVVDGDGAWLLEVVDDGMGINEADLPHMFESFFRGSAAINGTTAGAGLGLAIVRAIADAHGASIQVASREGEGTIVSVLVPKDVPA